MKIYTGIGSRITPPDVLRIIVGISKYLALTGWTLRSGGAPGADSAFEHGCDHASGSKEIYLPWKGFHYNQSPLYEITSAAYSLAQQFHPHWDVCSDTEKRIHARNGMLVRGPHLDSPSRFIVCWTPDGKEVDGTGEVLRIAQAYNIPVFNLDHHAEKDVYAYAVSRCD